MAMNSNELKHYKFIDQSVLENTIYYYYLAQFDNNGKSKSYDVKSVRTGECDHSELIIYPNPTNNDFTIAFPFYLNDEVVLDMIDASGKVVFSSKVKVQGDEYTMKELNELVSGIYFINVTTTTHAFNPVKLIKF